MSFHENLIILLSAIATVLGLLAVGIADTTVGFPGEWSVVVVFVLFVGLGYVLPQVYLMKVDDSTSRVSRLGVITLMLLLVATSLSNSLSGSELVAMWAIVVAWSAVIFGYEVRDGYRESTGS